MTTSTTNTTTLEGNLTREPQLRFMPRGTPVCEFSIAFNRYYRDSDTAEIQEVTSFFDCRIFGDLAHDAIERLHKGYTVSLTGSLEQERWRDRDEQPHSRIWIVVDQFQIRRRPRRSRIPCRAAEFPDSCINREPMTEVFYSTGGEA